MSQEEPREYTEDEVREKFLKHIIDLIGYWHNLPAEKTMRERMEGLAFSILVSLDGESLAVPAFQVIPAPHPDDKDYLQSIGENWFPHNCDISGCLHDTFCRLQK